MNPDSAYLAKALPMARLLYEASHGDFECVPENYSEHFSHCFQDGDVSLLSAFSKFSAEDELENWELDEAIELLSKVEPDFWPDPESIEHLDLGGIFSNGDEEIEDRSEKGELEFVEDNLSSSEKVQKVISAVIHSVFGEKVDTIRDRSGNFPSPKNNFLQDEDGTFSGTFKYDNYKFLFEILPTEQGWVCTYRMDEKSLDSLERNTDIKNTKKSSQRRKVRHRGWS